MTSEILVNAVAQIGVGSILLYLLLQTMRRLDTVTDKLIEILANQNEIINSTALVVDKRVDDRVKEFVRSHTIEREGGF
jgi:hypothetical protein